MTSEKRYDAKISGDGTLPGGNYKNVVINGAGTVDGDLEGAAVKINGAGTLHGDVKAETIVVNGAGTIDGSVQATRFDVNGQADVHGGVGVSQVRVRGTVAIDGGVRSHETDVRGEIRVGGDLDADSLTGEGRFTVSGLVNAGLIDWRLHGKSGAREIGGERIVIGEPTGFTRFVSFFVDQRLVTDSIEGDTLDLEWVKAKVVRGGNIRLGVGCEVDLVEYSGTLTSEAGAQVKEERKIEAEKA